eukprot:CAMPEP_0119431992 /NCGR_PEP_ID=MMETSP1335-20130426/46982_1 /TAXON_ID=259385 /ORGANISM="Chrysoculter rhomboideus, Strain RCC1486" /LENGTH=167 /DNA_ID=CAMNT_0007457803 /DNA_START=173 /DNA_END=673 /DNA_ORIENTATION=+
MKLDGYEVRNAASARVHSHDRAACSRLPRLLIGGGAVARLQILGKRGLGDRALVSGEMGKRQVGRTLRLVHVPDRHIVVEGRNANVDGDDKVCDEGEEGDGDKQRSSCVRPPAVVVAANERVLHQDGREDDARQHYLERVDQGLAQLRRRAEDSQQCVLVGRIGHAK